MKAFSAAILTALTSAGDPAGITSNGSQSEATKTILLQDLATAGSPVDLWWMETMSIYDHDTGDQWLRVTHTLVMDISSDDIVSFELAF